MVCPQHSPSATARLTRVQHLPFPRKPHGLDRIRTHSLRTLLHRWASIDRAHLWTSKARSLDREFEKLFSRQPLEGLLKGAVSDHWVFECAERPSAEPFRVPGEGSYSGINWPFRLGTLDQYIEWERSMLGRWRKAVIFLPDFEFSAYFFNDPYAVGSVKIFLENPVADEVGSFVSRFQTWGFNNFRWRFRKSSFGGLSPAHEFVCRNLPAPRQVLAFRGRLKTPKQVPKIGFAVSNARSDFSNGDVEVLSDIHYRLGAVDPGEFLPSRLEARES